MGRYHITQQSNSWDSPTDPEGRNTISRARTFGAILLLGLLAAALAGCCPTGYEADLAEQITVPNFDASYPVHGEVLTKPPDLIDVSFKTELQEGSTFSVYLYDEAVSIGEVVISEDPWLYALSMGASFEGDTGEEDSADGVYHVYYTACWADGSCDEGLFGFIVDSTSAQ